LPRLLNAGLLSNNKREDRNDLLAEYFNLILRSRRRETCFQQTYLGGLPLFILAAGPVWQTSVRANPPNSEAGLPA